MSYYETPKGTFNRRFDYVHKETPLFSTHEDIQNKKGRFKMARFNYLQALVTEFQDSEDEVGKTQVLAHLANFAYDPVNYDWLRKLHVIDLFMDMLTEQNEQWKEFGIGGLCNLCLDPRNAKIIVENKGLPLIIRCLSSPTEETVLSAMTTLYYLLSPRTYKDILIKPVIDCFRKYTQSSNVRIKNLATLFLQDLPQQQEQQ